MLPVVIFDDRTEALDALIDLRPTFDIRTGCFTTRRRIEHAASVAAGALFTPHDLAPLAIEPGDSKLNTWPDGDEYLLISGRCVLPPDEIWTLERGHALRDTNTGDIIAARLQRTDAQSFFEHGDQSGMTTFHDVETPCLLQRPWDVIRFRNDAILRDLQAIGAGLPTHVAEGVTVMAEAPIHVHATATIAPGVVLDATHGAIAIDRGATVRPGAIIVGPAYVGEQSTVLEHALIKANTAIGPVCKVAGEVGGSILQSHSNKGHDGHIGDTWIGQWVNLGAGTTNSNLLNTYGEVTAACSPRSRRERTGLTFFGAIIADHVKTAICTKLMTGSVIGLGAMIACTAPPPTSVRRFAWLTDAGESRFRLDRFFDAADRMMERRSMSISPELRRRLEALHDDQAD